eukprot:TRINITY_DN609_c0_g1_i1.p1 TRINITY_DN609_c0_g1~~TRINITY_DN609_c0_g1_i1.p1  ORF type:complete len:537 (-),score=261.04 TRINITY_DN609_c0_g1_i1:152-1762(-)
MSSIKLLNPKSEQIRQFQALGMNIQAAKGLQGVLKTNLGPRGTIKMLVNGSGDIKLTKDGNVLLHEMQIQHPTASLIARAATAQDDVTGDGTTSNVLIIGEALRQSERFLTENVHPRVLADGFELARVKALEVLERLRIAKDPSDREALLNVARTSLRTKVHRELADQLAEIATDAILTIQKPGQPIDLFMVEIQMMQHRSDSDTRLVKGLVLDHGCRHPEMPKRLKNVHILTCNVSLEYEKPEINAGMFYSSAEKREDMAVAERSFVDQRVKQIIDLKRQVCKEGEGFIVINQKGIDPESLDMLAKEGIMGLRRAKRRNMERLTLACGGTAINSTEGINADVLGFATDVYEYTLGEEKFTFIEGVKNPLSCTILIKGPNAHTITQIKDAIRDGLRAVKNTIEDKSVIPGAGAFEVAAYVELMKYKDTIKGRAKLGVHIFAEALLSIPKTLAQNSGLDPHDAIIALQSEHSDGHIVGLDLDSGEPFDPETEGVFDNYRVKRQQLYLCAVLASQLLLVDEVVRAGKGGSGAPQGPPQ